MAKKSAKVEAPSREELVALAKQMNEVMGLEPKIKTTSKVSDDDLLENIMSEAVGNIYETDFEEDEEDDEKVIFNDESTATLKKLGVEIVVGESADEEEAEEEAEEEKPAKKGKKEAVKEEPAKKGKKAPVVEEDDEGVEEKPVKKGKKSEPVKEEKPPKGKKPAVVEDDDDGEETPAPKGKKAPVKTEKQVAKDKANAEKKERLAAKKGTKKSGGKYSRAESIADAIKAGPATYDELRIKSGKLYAEKNGGSFDPNYTNWYMEYSFPIMEHLGIIAKGKGDKLTFTL